MGGGLGPGYHVVGGYDFADNTANPYDGGPAGGHGTEVAGVIASLDTADPGVAPGVDLVALKVFDNNGNGLTLNVDEALQWVEANRNAFRYPITTINLSLGNGSNSESVPVGGGFESDLAQLQADGIFISVSAGNDFAASGQPGLSYPAVSPYVVPVASANANGQLSSFSQRDSRVLVAPGSNLLTTVPSYVINQTGADDDFNRCSGTSIASAYVAGAAALLRQADQTAGIKNISETMLYDQLYQTADIVFDPATGQNYHRINLERAIDSVMAAWTPPTTTSAAAPAASSTSVPAAAAAAVPAAASSQSTAATSSAAANSGAALMLASASPANQTPTAPSPAAVPLPAAARVTTTPAPAATPVPTGTPSLVRHLGRGSQTAAVSALPASEVVEKLPLHVRLMLAEP